MLYVAWFIFHFLMLEYNEIKPKKIIVFEGAPYEVLDSHVFRKQQRKPVNATKLKNLMTGKVTEYSFHQSEKAEEADIKEMTAVYLYKKRGERWFSEKGNPSNRFMIAEDVLGDGARFMKENTEVALLSFGDKTIGVKLPIKVTLKVVEAPPSTRGNTAQGGSKQVKLETGTMIPVPLFINEGDTIEINTESGDYVQRI